MPKPSAFLLIPQSNTSFRTIPAIGQEKKR